MVYNNSIILFAVLRRRQLCSISQKCIQTDVHITCLDLAVSKNSGKWQILWKQRCQSFDFKNCCHTLYQTLTNRIEFSCQDQKTLSGCFLSLSSVG